ncbi:Aminoglycoside phosphotransferase [Moelleriella libera RCEF 2490]|uniref:Aminoglycoside phosphotransferase n=1 Tax=Moelleriella libera RCEF 2490 TaxID=1081109 RepID=A0A162I7N8_9HYPO|nr:Aminoglycoside phosphotransferase [Moelleriella libera RCEF 2490]
MTTRDLLSGPITLSSARARSSNVLHALAYPKQKEDFYKRMESHRPLIADVVAHHLGTESTEITVSSQDWWRHGSFNLCIPIRVDVDRSAKPRVPEFVLMRFPLPYRVGEATKPGNSDEKVNCEAATYAWLQENCPSVPIPKLYGFGLSTNQRFTNLDLRPWWTRLFWRARRFFSALFGFQQPSRYVCHRSSRFADLNIGYLLIETITSGGMLSESWDEECNNIRLRENLQRDLAKIMLLLANVSLPRIGTFRLDSKGYLHLDNRPLSVQSTIQENEGIPPDVPTTFSKVNDFVLHHLAAFDNQLLHQPNAIDSRDDAYYQMTSLAAAKTILPQLFRKDLSNGPFVFALTDLHRSNIFVNEDWKITCIIDLEFACSLPIEFLQPPYWLGGKLIDEIEPIEFAPRHAEFLKHLKHEEQLQTCRRDVEPLSSIMQQSWIHGGFWATLALRNPIAFTSIFYDRILPDYFSFSSEELNKADYRFFARLWRRDISGIVDRKLQDRNGYLERLKEVFTNTSIAAITRNHLEFRGIQ